MQAELSQTKGYVYILINPSMPNLLKIGKSTRSPETRALELSQATGVPYSFQVVYQTLVDNCDVAEKEIHEVLNTYRTKKNREFFRIPLNQAIDQIRKVIADKGLKSNNLDIEPYKFAFEEFHSPEALFSLVLSDEDKWKQAKLHLQSGYLEDWLKKKGEYDALINTEKYSDRKEEQDFFLSLISFSIVPTKFRLFGHNLETLNTLFNDCQVSPPSEGLTEFLFNKKVIPIYEGFLKSKGLDDDRIIKWLRFIQNPKNCNYKDRKERMLKILEWKLYPSRFLYFKTMNFGKAEYLLTQSQWLAMISEIHMPNDVLTDALSKDEERVRNAVKYVQGLKCIFSSTVPDGFVHGDDHYPSGLHNYVPSLQYIREAEGLSPLEYKNFLEGLLPQKELKELSEFFILPLKLSEHLTEGGNFIDFIYAKEIVRFLLCEDRRIREVVDESFYFNFRKILESIVKKRYANLIAIPDFDIEKKKIKELPYSLQQYLRKKYPNKDFEEEKEISQYFFNPQETDDLWVKYLEAEEVTSYISFWEYPSSIKAMNSYLNVTYGYCNSIGAKVRGCLIERSGLKQEIDRHKEKFIIPKQLCDLFEKDNFSYLNFFENSPLPKIQRKELEERLIPSSIVKALESEKAKECFAGANRLKNILGRTDMWQNYSLNLAKIPTRDFVEKHFVPHEILEKLTSEDDLIYTKGFNEFDKFKAYFLPQKTFNALEREFIIPNDVKIKIEGISIEDYTEAIERLFQWGVVVVNESCTNQLTQDVPSLIRNLLFNKDPNRLSGISGLTFHLYSGKWIKKEHNQKKAYLNRERSKNWGEEIREIQKSKPQLLGWAKSLLIESIKEIVLLLQGNTSDTHSAYALLLTDDNILISKRDFRNYTSAIGEEGTNWFNASVTVSADNYSKISKIIEKNYDLRINQAVDFLSKNIRSKLTFISGDILDVLEDYLNDVRNLKRKMHYEDVSFIFELTNFVKSQYIFIYLFKRKCIINFLKENYFLYKYRHSFTTNYHHDFKYEKKSKHVPSLQYFKRK